MNQCWLSVNLEETIVERDKILLKKNQQKRSAIEGRARGLVNWAVETTMRQ